MPQGQIRRQGGVHHRCQQRHRAYHDGSLRRRIELTIGGTKLAAKLNDRPRETLGGITPAEALQHPLFDPKKPIVATTARFRRSLTVMDLSP